MTAISLERIASVLYPEPKKQEFAAYGRVDSINTDGSYQVQLNASSTMTRCARLCEAKENDRVFVIISNGQCAAIGRVGGAIQGYELIWTNQAPLSPFSGQTLTFTGDFSAYILTYEAATEYPVCNSVMLPVPSSIIYGTPTFAGGGNYRTATTTASTILFDNGTGTTSCVPLYLWGIK